MAKQIKREIRSHFAMASVNYRPLESPNHIRLVNLLPGATEEPLQATIIHTSLETPPSYQALSYVWGSGWKEFNLESSEGVIPITASLHSALKRLRRQGSPTLLWADAVCINQSDNQEKSRQIRLMRDVFGRASSVVAYLGVEADDSHLMPDLLRNIVNANYNLGPGEWLLASAGESSLPDISDKCWGASRAFLSRPWFRRVWILQEVAVAAEVRIVCGAWSESWELFESAMNKVHEHSIAQFSGDPNNYDVTIATSEIGFILAWRLICARATYQEGTRWPLLKLLDVFRGTEATRARDHLFALLGLAGDAHDSILDPDYDARLEEVFTRYTAFFVNRDQSLRLICNAGLGAMPHRFPSWVPDWTIDKNKLSGGNEDSPEDFWHAAKGSKPKIRPYRDRSILVVGGGLVDTVVKVSVDHQWEPGDLAQGVGPGPVIRRLRDSDEILAILSSYPTGENLHEVYWRTLIRNLCAAPEGEQKPTVDFEVSHKAAREYLDRSEGAGERLDARSASTKALWVKMQPYMLSLLTIFEDMLFCITEKGYMGLVPPKTEPGDVISVLIGGPTPFILRKFGLEVNHYCLVGSAYIHGIMEGESLDMASWCERDILLH